MWYYKGQGNLKEEIIQEKCLTIYLPALPAKPMS